MADHPDPAGNDRLTLRNNFLELFDENERIIADLKEHQLSWTEERDGLLAERKQLLEVNAQLKAEVADEKLEKAELMKTVSSLERQRCDAVREQQRLIGLLRTLRNAKQSVDKVWEEAWLDVDQKENASSQNPLFVDGTDNDEVVNGGGHALNPINEDGTQQEAVSEQHFLEDDYYAKVDDWLNHGGSPVNDQEEDMISHSGMDAEPDQSGSTTSVEIISQSETGGTSASTVHWTTSIQGIQQEGLINDPVMNELSNKGRPVRATRKRETHDTLWKTRTKAARRKGNGRRQSRRRDPNAPKGPLNTYTYFLRDERPRIKRMFPYYSSNEVTKELCKQWKCISPTTKMKYEVLANGDKLRCRMEMEEYAKNKIKASVGNCEG